MISNELKEEKNFVALLLFSMIMFVLTSRDIGRVFFLIILIVIVFYVLKWIFWIFLKPSSKDEEKTIKRKKLVDKIVSFLVGSFMLLLLISQLLIFSDKFTRPSYHKSTHSTNTTHINVPIDYKTHINIHSDLNSCESLKSRFLSCVGRSARGLECFPGTDIVLPARCRD
jgi:NADH:ubiquinone oxidoreductase subunit 5 (subunit L)/multisubunit Na+/H+ antiporter MnhA subunit